MIERLELKNFTAFNSVDIKFGPKINVFIGENGTGKTHLLKAAYGLCGGGVFNSAAPIAKEDLEGALSTKLIRLFMPLDEKLGKMRRHGTTEKAEMVAHFSSEQKLAASFSANSKAVNLQESTIYSRHEASPVFIPTKEVLSFMKGFTSLYEKYGLSFDLTYQDICQLLDLPELRSEALHEKAKWAMDEVANICGGRFIFSGGGKVSFKTDKAEYSANAMAEGFRKIGMLSRLLETGAIQPGISGPLFWDEPESNMNPKLMKLLVQILLDLSRRGQQIILATHDYILLKWFDLLMDRGKDDHVRFHALFRDPATGEIQTESASSYRQLTSNAIASTFSELYDSEIDRSLGVQSK